jgi:XTP/dITP diphosphohydrolase
VVIATGNSGKLDEFRELLAGTGLELVGHAVEVEESGSSYEKNAVLKARAATEETGLPALGDDSGIEVEALGGFPGLISARLGPTQATRTAELLRRLEGHPRPWRARFVAALALSIPGKEPTVVRGTVEGEILPDWRGGLGFGYDPVFYVAEVGKTFGEMEPSLKHRWSHRGRAVRALIETGALARLTSA